MPSGTAIHALIFAAGAALGATTISIANRRKDAQPNSPTIGSTLPLVQVSPTSVGGQFSLQGVSTDVLKYGHPGPVSDLLDRKAYIAAYDRRMRHPAWTAEHLTLASIKPDPTTSERGDRSNSAFKEDESIPSLFRAWLKDYFRSGYDRGHMVPAADASLSQEAMDETFYLTNIAPQVGDGFNRHYWAYLEKWCRKLTSSYSDVFVFTVPLYLPKKDPDGKWRVTHEVIGNPPNISVPTHFAKVVLASRPASAATPLVVEISTGAFVLPNAAIPDETPLTSFSLPIDAVERASGLNFFSDTVKKSSKHICQTTKCEVVVRRFDDTRKAINQKN